MSRANEFKKIPIQFNGLMPIFENWLYYIEIESDIFTMPMSLEVENANSIGP
jgi:hypothetical protein